MVPDLARKARAAALLALGLGGAFAAGRWTAPAHLAPPREAGAAAPASPTACSPAPLALLPPSPGLDELRQLVHDATAQAVREELARGPIAASPAATSAPEPAREPSPEQLAAQQEALRFLGEATARRRFTSADRERWRSLLTRLDDDERFELQRRLLVAVNRQEILPDPQVVP